MSIYRSPDGESKILALYESQLANLPIRYEIQMLDTLFGLARVLTAGPDYAQPLVVLHDLYLSAPLNTEIWFPLSDEFKVYSVDIIDQPGRNAEDRPPPRDNNYGKWVMDILNCLSLECTAFLGIGLGGAILLDAAAREPEHISRAVLVAPAGVAAASLPHRLWAYLRWFIPWLACRSLPCRGGLVRAVHPLASEVDDDLLPYLDLVTRHVKWGVECAGPFNRKQLKKFKAPTLLIVAKNDILFPMSQVVSRARDIIPNLIAVEVIDGSHIPTRHDQYCISRMVRQFLKGQTTRTSQTLANSSCD